MALCANCQTEIPRGQAYTVQVDRASGAAPDIVVHADPRHCAPTTPVRRTPRP